jgi:hypothetical protein
MVLQLATSDDYSWRTLTLNEKLVGRVCLQLRPLATPSAVTVSCLPHNVKLPQCGRRMRGLRQPHSPFSLRISADSVAPD